MTSRPLKKGPIYKEKAQDMPEKRKQNMLGCSVLSCPVWYCLVLASLELCISRQECQLLHAVQRCPK